MSNSPGLQQLSMPNKLMGQFEPLSSLGSQPLPIPGKLMGPMEPIFNGSQRLLLFNKGMVSHNPKVQHFSAPRKRTVQIESMSCKLGSQQLSLPKKRSVQVESSFNKPVSQQLAMSKKRTAQMEPSPKGQLESFESVRSKLRESLAASLALVSQKQRQLETVGKNSPSEAASAPKHPHEVPQPAGPASANVVKDELLQGNGLCWASDLDAGSAKPMEGNSAKRPKLVNGEICVHSGESKPFSPETLAFKIEADLFKLFGGVNKKYKEKGRSLLFNLKDQNNPELRERVMAGEISHERFCSMTAEELASKELSQWRLAKAEELAQMVVLPDSEVDIRRLVRKTHKGEFQVEFEHDDSVSVEVAMGASSLTQVQSKTSEKVAQLLSKGIETETSEAFDEQYQNNSEDHNLRSDLTTLPHDGTDPMQGLMMEEFKDAEFLPQVVSLDEFMESLPSKPPFENSPGDAARATLASDEKNASSVDSKLDSSDIGSVDLVDTSAYKLDKSEAKYTRTGSNIKSNHNESEAKYSRTEGISIKSNNIHVDSETSLGGDTFKGEYVWEGLLQLNISTITVTGIFKSGEKTSMEEWPSLVEIKGRVRLDAFEKFLQQLPMSRSRAIMVVQFCCKEGSRDSRHKILYEVADSYVVGERVGFAEPVPGVELYFCPLNSRTVEMLVKHLSKDHTGTLNSAENGLIGIVVWRKALLTSTISPNSSLHHKHNLKVRHSLGRHHEDTIVNATFKPPLTPCPPTNPAPPLDDEPIADVPPGFGPAAAGDDDDLPEFDFVRPSNPSQVWPVITPIHALAQPPPFRPVGQMRVNWQPSRGVRVEVQPWNDDDDIPEWQPQLPSQQPLDPSALPVHGFQQPNTHIVSQQHLASVSSQWLPQYPSHPKGSLAPEHPMLFQPLQTPVNMTQGQGQQTGGPAWQQGSWWAPPPVSYGLPVQPSGSMQPCHSGGQSNEGQFYGTPGFGVIQHVMDWKQDASRNREF
ncbi:death-inducer obliterator 1-like [Macadamia integrifolia]|uniref:death-inducer obliterator 1-like n=1 Tax=Macadamia integrifolia TaxID=60698 RepID=UPI001C533A60|nr:death-inducer obliterator 1-like [Macadamia integrifolia]